MRFARVLVLLLLFLTAWPRCVALKTKLIISRIYDLRQNPVHFTPLNSLECFVQKGFSCDSLVKSEYITWPKNFVFGQILFSSACMYLCVCVCVCVCVCEGLPRLSQKVLDRFQWNLIGWCIIIKDKFLLKMRWIGLIKRIPRPFIMLISPYITKCSGKLDKTLFKWHFYHLIHYSGI